jgi:F-type H+-transporting ATPase subunit a
MMQQVPFRIDSMIFVHTGDAHDLDFAPLGSIRLPEWAPVHIGSFTVDFSPTKYVVLMILAATIVFVMLKTAAIGIARARKEGRAPRGYAGAMEAFVLWTRDEIAIQNIGPVDGPKYAPLIMSFFFFILTCNLIGLLPWGSTPSGNLAVTGALALIAFLVFEVQCGIKLGLKGYLRTIFPKVEGLGPAAAVSMSMMMAPIEFMSKLVKPFALMVRLFGNMTAGHFVILALFGIVFLFGHLGVFSYAVGFGSAAIVLGVMGLELFVAALQAYIFAMLTAVFIGLMRTESH